MIRELLRSLVGLTVPKRSPFDRLAFLDPDCRIYETANLVNVLGDPSRIRVGANTHVRGELLLFGHGGEITLGNSCYLGEQSRIWSAKKISIGDRVLIAHLVTITDNLTHPLSAKKRRDHFESIIQSGHPNRLDLEEEEVVIEDDCWIASHSVVLKGITIGEGAIVGAGSVVTKDVPPYVLVAGNPARIVRKLDRDG